MDKVKEEQKKFVEDKRALAKEKQEWHTDLASLKRDKLQLITSNRVLEKKKSTYSVDIDKYTTKLEELKQLVANETHKSIEIASIIDELESKRADKVIELADLQLEVKTRKSTIEYEVSEYALERKTAIKDEILLINQELIDNKREVKTLTEEAERIRRELILLNQAAIQEQEDLKITKSTVDQDLLDKQSELDELQRKVEDTKDSIQKLMYERDNAMITIAKAKEEHEKFVAYEQKARKILDAKDRELTERSTDIAQESQLLKNKRSFLPPL